MRYINYFTEKIALFNDDGLLIDGGYRIYNLFLIDEYIKNLNLSDEGKFIENINSYIKNLAMPEFMSIHKLTEEDFLKIKKYYNKKIYQDMRSAFSEVCCMCGGFGPSQLDHILDKEYHPSYYSFIRNLAPVCACNQSKVPSRNTRGTLHPYIDTILAKRIVRFSYEKYDNGNLKSIKIVPVQDYINVGAVLRHIDNVFRGATLKRAIQVAMLRLEEVKKIALDDCDVIKRECILKFISNKNRYKTPNNWNSMSYIGIMDFYGISYTEEDLTQ